MEFKVSVCSTEHPLDAAKCEAEHRYEHFRIII